MRVAIFHPDFHATGGAELLAAMHVGYLSREGFNPGVITYGYDPGSWSERMAGVPVEIVKKREWSDILFGLSRMAKLRRRSQRAGGVLKQFDVVVAHNYPCSAMLGFAKIPGRKLWYCNEPPRSLYLRQANPRLAGQVLGGGALETFACPRFQNELKNLEVELQRNSTTRARYLFDQENIVRLEAISANSEYTRNNLQAIYGRSAERVIYPVVRFPSRISPRQGMDRSGLRVLVHSRLELLKNIDTVIRGFARFLAHCPRAQLHLVGDGPARAALERLARELLPEGIGRFHGYLVEAELQKVYEACDVLALLPLDEPFGMVFPEAAVKGLLIVGPDHGGPMEIMDGGSLGWPVDAFSPDALADVFSRIWSLSDAEVDRRRQAADRACRKRYDLEIIGPQLRDFVRGIH